MATAKTGHDVEGEVVVVEFQQWHSHDIVKALCVFSLHAQRSQTIQGGGTVKMGKHKCTRPRKRKRERKRERKRKRKRKKKKKKGKVSLVVVEYCSHPLPHFLHCKSVTTPGSSVGLGTLQ